MYKENKRIISYVWLYKKKNLWKRAKYSKEKTNLLFLLLQKYQIKEDLKGGKKVGTNIVVKSRFESRIEMLD